ncbi:amino acid adenylation domain-containing protein [Pendulispora albinea]|uniref:Amino acid adenylation domain-containing protein n=1 Tax=Pendulispora albinea TaxID=2741071 RepID=A0ABZ2M9Y6_9BACT
MRMDFELAVHRLIAQQAARTPHAEAIVAGDSRVSYGELHRQSDAMAVRLRRAGVGRDAIVGVCAERSIELMVALLGILKAGGAYLYLDPGFPRERLAFMCDDAAVRFVLVSRASSPSLDAIDAVDALAAQRMPIADFSDEELEANVASPEQDGRALAYVVYTSGSTGRPKGVAVEHHSLSHLARALVEAYGIGPSDRILQFASPSWDTMVEEVFPTWLAGAALVLRHPDMIESKALLRGCARSGVTIIMPPTAIWHRLVADIDEESLALPKTLRAVIIGGEAAAPDRLDAWLARVGTGVRLLNEYGLTEATAVCTIADLSAGGWDAEPHVPIGLPLPRVGVSIRNEALEPVPDGVVGEICVLGEGVARGYIHRPELTASKFVPDPISGGRMYRSGDMGFRRPDGQFVCTGRLDAQIKVGGVRIEPAEIEAVLREHDEVADAIVQMHEAEGERRLIAHVVQKAGARSSAAELRTFARARLPATVVPEIAFLEALPLTASGKIDRAKLSAPASPKPPHRAAEGEPLEAALCALARGILGAASLAPDDDFFDAGGNSLLATKLIGLARREFGVDLSFERLLIARTMRSVAAHAESEAPPEGPGISPRPADVSPGASSARRLASLGQQWFWLAQQEQPETATAYNMMWLVHIEGALDPARVERVLIELTSRHEPLRTIFVEGAGEQPADCAVVLTNPPVSLRHVDWAERAHDAKDVTAFAERDAKVPFDLSRELPFRATLIRRGRSTWTLVVCLHHIAADGYSLAILVRDAEAVYAALQRGEEPCLPPLPVAYLDFAVWERDFMASEAAKRQLAYWRQQLRGAPSIVALAFDRPRPPEHTRGGDRLRDVWEAARWSAVRALAREHGATPYMVLLAVFAESLRAWSGQTDLVIGSAVAGRTRPELEPLVGFFPNPVALRIDLSGAPTFRELVGRVRTTCLNAFANADVPSDAVAHALGVRGDPPPPLYRVVFAQPPKELFARPIFEGLKLEVEEIDQEARGFHDLVLELVELDQGASVTLEYNCDLFDRATAERMLDDFRSRVRRTVDSAAAR